MASISKFSLDKLSNFVESQIPRFIKDNNENFVNFIKSYYQFNDDKLVDAVIVTSNASIDSIGTDEGVSIINSLMCDDGITLLGGGTTKDPILELDYYTNGYQKYYSANLFGKSIGSYNLNSENGALFKKITLEQLSGSITNFDLTSNVYVITDNIISNSNYYILKLIDVIGTFAVGDVIIESSTNTTATVIAYDSVNLKLTVTNPSYGFFHVGKTISKDTNNRGTIESISTHAFPVLHSINDYKTPIHTLTNLFNFGDIDFVFSDKDSEHFKLISDEILKDWPKEFYPVIEDKTKAIIAQNISDVYAAKGTAGSIETISKILWNDEVSIENPSEKMHLLNGGEWYVEPKQLTVKIDSYGSILDSAGTIIYKESDHTNYGYVQSVIEESISDTDIGASVTEYNVAVTFDSTPNTGLSACKIPGDRIAICYNGGTGSGTNFTLGVVKNSTIDFSAGYVGLSNEFSSSMYNVMCYDAHNDCVMIGYENKVIVGQSRITMFAFLEDQEILDSGCYIQQIAYVPDLNSIGVIYYDSSANLIYLRVGNIVSGIFSWTTTALNLTNAAASNNPKYFSILGINDSIICTYKASGKVYSETYTVESSTLSLTSFVDFFDTADDIKEIYSTYDPYNNKIIYVVGYGDILMTAVATADNITDLLEYGALSSISNYEYGGVFQNIGAAYDSSVNNIVFSWEVKNTALSYIHQFIKIGLISNDIFNISSDPIQVELSDVSKEYIIAPEVISNKAIVLCRPDGFSEIRYSIIHPGKTGNAILSLANEIVGGFAINDYIIGTSSNDEAFESIIYDISNSSNYLLDYNLLNGGREQTLPSNYIDWTDSASKSVANYDIGSRIQDSYFYQPYAYNIKGNNFYSSDNFQVSKVATGYDHNIAIKLDGNIIIWGNNEYGQLGDNTRVSEQTPIELSAGSNQKWIDVSSGLYTSYAIKAMGDSDHGTLWSWGRNNYGQLGYDTSEYVYGDVYTNTSSLVQVGTETAWKGSFTRGYAAVKNDGTLWSWGYNGYGQVGNGTKVDCFVPVNIDIPTMVAADECWLQVVNGATHSAAITTYNNLWVWGNNEYGQIGTGDTDTAEYLTPVQIPGYWRYVVVGYTYTIAIDVEGKLWGWGNNEYGQLGTGDTTERLTPVQIGTSSNWLTVDTQYYHCVAIDNDNKLWAWGKNNYGAIGDDTTVDKNVPTQITDSTWIKASAGVDHTLAIKSDGTLWAWGGNKYGTLGLDENVETALPDFTILTLIPTQILVEESAQPTWSTSWFDDSISTVVGHDSKFYATVDTDGTLWAWGSNEYGQLGIGNDTFKAVPARVGSDTNWKQVALGSNYTLALKTDGTLWAWGRNDHGQLGLGDTVDRNSPVRVGSATTWSMIVAGQQHTMAIKADGTLWAWGINEYGQLGLNSSVDKLTPTKVGSATTWRMVMCAAHHTMAVKNNGTLWVWGRNDRGQLGNGNIDITPLYVPTQLGTDTNWSIALCADKHTLALKTDGTLWAWGNNEYGVFGNGTFTDSLTPIKIGTDTDWKQIVTNFYHTLALKTDGTLWAWGWNNYGQLGDNKISSTNIPVQIGTGTGWRQIQNSYTSSYATDSIGNIYSWGQDDAGQLGYIPGYVYNDNIEYPIQVDASTDWKDISAVHLYSAAIKTNGSLWTWGYNRYGQLAQGTTIDYNVPTKVKSDYIWSSVSCLQNSLHVVRNDGSLFAAGYNETGNLGTTSGKGYYLDITDRLYPSQVGLDFDWKSVVSNTVGSFALGIKTDGTLWAWGYNEFGQLGDGTHDNKFEPIQVGKGTVWSKVSAGKDYVVALSDNGILWAWGRNNYGQLGNGTTDYVVPSQVTELKEWKDVSCGSISTIAIKLNGTLWAWGNNDYGQLGNGKTNNKYSPVQISSKPWIYISAGEYYNFAINNNNELYAWGNSSKCLGIETSEPRITSPTKVGSMYWDKVIGGSSTSFGIYENTLYSWGQDYLGNKYVTSSYDPVRVISIPKDAVIIDDYKATMEILAHPAGMKMFINGE